MIKTALSGLGRIGWQFHLPQIMAHKDFMLTAVVDPVESRLEEAKAITRAKGYTDYEEMLQGEKPQLVVIASPTMFHEAQAIAAFAIGADVILDKPMSYDLASAKRIAEAAEKYGRKLTVYQPHRYTAEVLAAKRVLESGVLGNLVQIKRRNHGYVRRNDWQAFTKHGGGMLNNYGAHYIDQALYLSQDKVKHLLCKLRNVAGMGDAEDMVKVLMETESGIVLDVEINQGCAIAGTPLAIYGDRGAAVIKTDGNGNPELYVRYYLPQDLSERVVDEGLAAPGRAYPSEQIPWKEEHIPILQADAGDYYADCADYFARDAKPPVDVRETLYLMELMHLCREQNT